MRRYNIFKPVHKGLRALLYDTALILQQTEFTDASQAGAAMDKISLVLKLFESHAYLQDYFILPTIEKFDKPLVNEFRKEQEFARHLVNGINNLVEMFETCHTNRERNIAGSAITKAYMDFMIFNLKEMAKEESLLNESLWRHFSNRELLLMEQEIIESIPASEMAVYGKWMIKGMSDSELVRWFGKLKNSAPEYLYNNLLTLTEMELPSSRWNKIEEAVGEEAMVA
jgi:hypothetical protein